MIQVHPVVGILHNLPFTRTFPVLIHFRASVREPAPALEKARSRVFSGRLSSGPSFFVIEFKRLNTVLLLH